MAFGISPDGNSLYVGQDDKVVVLNTRTGVWFTIASNTGGIFPAIASVHPDHHAFVFAGNGTLYDGNDGGIWSFQPGATPQAGTWTDLNTTGLNDIQVTAVEESPAAANLILIGSQDNGTARTGNGGQTWTTVGGGDGFQVHFAASNPAWVYKTTQNFGVEWSGNFGAAGTFQDLDGDLPGQFPFNTPFSIDPTNANYIVAGGIGRLWVSADGGENWTSTHPIPSTAAATCVTFFGPQGYVAGFSNGTIFESLGAGVSQQHWSTVMPWGNQPISGMVVDPFDPTIVYVTISAFGVPQVWRAQLTTVSWTATNIVGFGGTARNVRDGASVPNVPVNAIVEYRPNANDPPALFIGTDLGVYEGTLDGDPTDTSRWFWERYGTNFPNVQVTSLQIANGTLIAGTYGRGTAIPGLPKNGWKLLEALPAFVNGLTIRLFTSFDRPIGLC
jgi:hypothetical protein